jgi:hypothetical protein
MHDCDSYREVRFKIGENDPMIITSGWGKLCRLARPKRMKYLSLTSSIVGYDLSLSILTR